MIWDVRHHIYIFIYLYYILWVKHANMGILNIYNSKREIRSIFNIIIYVSGKSGWPTWTIASVCIPYILGGWENMRKVPTHVHVKCIKQIEKCMIKIRITTIIIIIQQQQNSDICLKMQCSSVYVCGVCADCAFLLNFIALACCFQHQNTIDIFCVLFWHFSILSFALTWECLKHGKW